MLGRLGQIIYEDTIASRDSSLGARQYWQCIDDTLRDCSAESDCVVFRLVEDSLRTTLTVLHSRYKSPPTTCTSACLPIALCSHLMGLGLLCMPHHDSLAGSQQAA